MNLGVYFHPEINVTSKGSAATQRSRTCIVFSVGRKYVHAVTMDGSIGCVEIARDTKLEPMIAEGEALPNPAGCRALSQVHADQDRSCREGADETTQHLGGRPGSAAAWMNR